MKLCVAWHNSFFLRFYLFIFRERGREGEKHQCVVVSCASPIGKLENFQFLVQPVKSLEVIAPVLTIRKQADKLKFNDSS